MCSIRLRAFLIALVATIATMSAMPKATSAQTNYSARGQPPDPGLELLQDEPHDLIYFTAESGGGWVKTLPLNLPNRRVPTDPAGALNYSILGIENKEFLSDWKDIEKVDLWELRLERETNERIAKGDFVGAYPFMSVLIRDFPNRPGLRRLRCDFLWQDALARVRKGEIAPTLAMLEELRQYDVSYRSETVLRAIDRVADRLLDELMKSKELDLAQQMLARLEQDYEDEQFDAVKKWNLRFLEMAREKQQQAITALEAKDYRSARTFAQQSFDLKPSIAGGAELLTEINTIHPIVNVGVLQVATDFEPTRIDNWSARRSGRLLYRTLFEIEGAGPEGGEYDFIFGDVEMSADRMQFDLLLRNDKLGPPLNLIRGDFIADAMAKRALPNFPTYFAPWASAVDSIALQGPKQVTFRLRRPNVLPMSLLQVPVDGSWIGGETGSVTGDYQVEASEEGIVRYKLSGEPRTPSQPREIIETKCPSAMQGVNLLLQGEIDVLDQLFPADAARLSSVKSVKVVNYPLPTVHMLVPCSDHPYLAEKTFRRALLYGTNRADILYGELLEGQPFEGCRVLSGPFPAGKELNDPLGYAYDQSIPPRPYELPLAKLLLSMNANQMESAARRTKQTMPAMTPIRVAHPADNLSRVACEAIRTQWLLLGLEVALVELPAGETFPPPDQDIADLVYVSAAVWEPFIDARRVLGPEGLAASNDQLVGLGLRRLEEAKNWKEVRDRLLDLHWIAHNELPVLPLWQMVDSFAYRRELIGVGSDIVSLYQNALNWQVTR